MSKREIAAAAAKKYVLSLNNATANPPADRYHSVITLITLGKAEEGENSVLQRSCLSSLAAGQTGGGLRLPIKLNYV